MPGYLIDVNLPHRFSLWVGADYRHVSEINDAWEDIEIWRYAKEYKLTIVTKDADFSDLSMLDPAPPKVIHIRIGNMRIRDLHTFLNRVWEEVCALSATHRLVRVYPDRIETIE